MLFFTAVFYVLSAEMSSSLLVIVRSITRTDTNTAALSHAHISNYREVVPRNSISSASGHRTEHSSL